jgi:hypothetical protein
VTVAWLSDLHQDLKSVRSLGSRRPESKVGAAMGAALCYYRVCFVAKTRSLPQLLRFVCGTWECYDILCCAQPPYDVIMTPTGEKPRQLPAANVS